jgi:hypothetical protein
VQRGRSMVEAAGVGRFAALTTRNLLILGSAHNG